MSRADFSPQQVKLRVEAELFRFKAWNARFEDKQLESDVVDLAKEVRHSLDRLHEMLSTGAQSRMPLFLSRQLSSMTGRNALESELQTCQQLNDALLEYSPTETSSIRPLLKGIEHANTMLEHTVTALDVLALEQKNLRVRIEHSVDQMKNSFLKPSMEYMPQFENNPNPSTVSTSIQTLHTLSVDGLQIFADSLDSDDFRELVSRLRIWCIGLLEGSLGLDQIFVPGTETDIPALNIGYQVLATSFVKMLINIERMLVILGLDDPGTLAYLGHVADLFDVPNIWEEMHNLAIIIAGPDEAGQDKDIIITCSTAIQDEIENLYDMLPAISSLRHLCCLREPPRSRRRPGSHWETAYDEVSKREMIPVVQLIKDNLHLSEAITASLREVQNVELRKEKSPALTIATLFENENRRLNEWTKSRKDKITREMTAILTKLHGSLTNLQEDMELSLNEARYSNQAGSGEGGFSDLPVSETLDMFRAYMSELEQLSKQKAKDKGQQGPEVERQSESVTLKGASKSPLM